MWVTFVESEKIDIEKAQQEHQEYCEMLKRCGAEVIILDRNNDLADSVFVEDPIIVFDQRLQF